MRRPTPTILQHLDWNEAAEMLTLHGITAVFAEAIKMLNGFHSFGGNT